MRVKKGHIIGETNQHSQIALGTLKQKSEKNLDPSEQIDTLSLLRKCSVSWVYV